MSVEQTWLERRTFLPFSRYETHLDSLRGAGSRQQGQIPMSFPSL